MRYLDLKSFSRSIKGKQEINLSKPNFRLARLSQEFSPVDIFITENFASPAGDLGQLEHTRVVHLASIAPGLREEMSPTCGDLYIRFVRRCEP